MDLNLNHVAGMLGLLVVLIFTAETTHANTMYSLIQSGNTYQCTDVLESGDEASFHAENCRVRNFTAFDPQGKSLWLRIDFDGEAIPKAIEAPFAVYVFAKASSQVYLNGELIGSNGHPSALAENEVIGKMDVGFYLPTRLLKPGKNQLLIHFSSHHGYLDLHRSIHFVGLATYGKPSDFIQQNSQLALVLLGALLLGGLYFSILSFNPLQRRTSALLALMAFIAAAQLFAEASRGILSYAYPTHDLRLVAITSFAFTFGSLILGFIAHKFVRSNPWHWFYGGVISTIIAISLVPGFDGKTTLAIFVPSLVATIIVGIRAIQTKEFRLLGYFSVFLAFLITVLLTLGYFHELILYVIITLLLCYLFIQQARDYTKEQEQRRAEEKQVAKLEFKLAQANQQQSPEFITLHSANTVDKVSTDDINYCQASGDYAELFLGDNRQKLFSGTLKKLEGELPNTFLRVHRSYLVNLDKVASLRSEGGSGCLILLDGSRVPVSRRLLPEVRTAMA
ncbi:LytTR family transcriptional regulator [Aliikangiella marina]|uniref:LytTR family transcriptional regulator n=1 Tax=Aliikangiella marina TaxID=1712262 RepID=A0A545T6C2_9GAMM|nr:LytTR family DNA-binding domain-containing protein [Aliikangiella marina]TQV72780.1 LytTR family transcriptional regulator [Aliikangiella marina]